ncbi:MAG: single-stranded DNA-binding protein, partial [Acholeplasmataceae bacterium]|nr:single-stranded DNA-binding protein [Acholeplasmataceae bacterium]
KEETTFVDVDVFGKQAETLGQYLKKGRPIYIEGRLKLETWDDKQTGQKRSRLGVVLESFQFIDGGTGSRDGGSEFGGVLNRRLEAGILRVRRLSPVAPHLPRRWMMTMMITLVKSSIQHRLSHLNY